MRMGELLALQWEDIDWERQAIHIHRTMINHHSRSDMELQNAAKSPASDRRLPLSSRAFDVLGEMYDGSEGYVFRYGDNPDACIGYPILRTQVQKICKAAGVKYQGMHIFRHTFASNAYRRGVEIKLLSKYLGHGDVAVTYNTYIHLFGDQVDALRAVVS